MAREFAQIRVAIWDDHDFVSLGPSAQRLYFLLTTRVDLGMSGIIGWHPGKLSELSSGTTAQDIEAAALELERARFIVIDRTTDECLVRALVRYDGSLRRGPKTAAGVVSSWRTIYSQTLKTVVACEIRRETDLSEAVLKALSPILGWSSEASPDAPSNGASHDVPAGASDTPQRQPATSNQQPTTFAHAVARADEKPADATAGLFADWWSHYPRKVAKGQAARAYRTAVTKTDHATLVAAVEQQSRRLMARGPDYCPYPATWLNGERWLDATPQRDEEIPGVEKWMNP